MKKQICPFCKTEFTASNNVQVYCGEHCRRGMYVKQKREKNQSRKFTCAYCGNVFVSKRKRKYCCEEHRKMANGRLLVKPRPRKKPNLSLAQINELARAEGLNYGQYVARYNL